MDAEPMTSSSGLTAQQSSELDSTSHKRRIETNRTVTPGGMVITQKTTVTEKPRDHRMEIGYAGKSDTPSKANCLVSRSILTV